jgi:KTSC domain
VPSTIIRAFDYHPVERQLVIRLTTGRCYQYHDVPPEAADAFRSAFNKGRHFNARIRNRYRFTELEAAADE